MPGFYIQNCAMETNFALKKKPKNSKVKKDKRANSHCMVKARATLLVKNKKQYLNIPLEKKNEISISLCRAKILS